MSVDLEHFSEMASILRLYFDIAYCLFFFFFLKSAGYIITKSYCFLPQVLSPQGVKYFYPQEAFCPACHSSLRPNHLKITQHPGIRHDYQLSHAGPI